MPEYIDIHSHVNFNAYSEDREAVIKRTLDENVWMINVGTQIDTSKKAIEMAHQYEKGVYAIIGLHPIHTSKSYHDEDELGSEGQTFTSREEIFNSDSYRALLEDKKVVALGECGLDYFRIENNELGIRNKEKQIEAFKSQIELAIEMDKPLMIHCRNAYKEAADILNSYFLIHNSRLRGDVHFFAGNWEEAKLFLDLGFTLSFTGVITFARNYDEVIKNTPLDMIMSETDCPYVTPAPYRGKRNEPLYVKEVVKKIAEIKGHDLSTVKGRLVENAKRVFNL